MRSSCPTPPSARRRSICRIRSTSIRNPHAISSLLKNLEDQTSSISEIRCRPRVRRSSTPIYKNNEDSIIPHSIDNYSLRTVLSEGSSSVVKLAFLTYDLTHKYACKIIESKEIKKVDDDENIEREVRIVQQIHNPYVYRIHDILRDDMRFYIIMEYYPKTLVSLILKVGKLDERKAAKLMKQICIGLKYLHENMNIAHRYIEPANILISEDETPIIAHFSRAIYCPPKGGKTVTRLKDKLCYAPPESLHFKQHDGKLGDCWSLGCVLYSMVVGNIPWSTREPSLLSQEILNGEYKIPNWVSDTCKSLITGLMCVDPKKRLTVDEALKHQFLRRVRIPQPQQLEPSISIKRVDEAFDDNKFDFQLGNEENENLNIEKNKSAFFTLEATEKSVQDNSFKGAAKPLLIGAKKRRVMSFGQKTQKLDEK